MHMTDDTIQALAVAVLKGDKDAALALADLVHQEWAGEGVRVPPVTRLSVDVGRLRVMVRFPANVLVDAAGVREAIRIWLHGGEPLLLSGAESVDLYELPASPAIELNPDRTPEELGRLRETFRRAAAEARRRGDMTAGSEPSRVEEYSADLRRWLELSGAQGRPMATGVDRTVEAEVNIDWQYMLDPGGWVETAVGTVRWFNGGTLQLHSSADTSDRTFTMPILGYVDLGEGVVAQHVDSGRLRLGVRRGT